MLDPIEVLKLRIEALERKLKDMEHLFKFHKMTIEEIPSCYKKAFPKPNEYPFFEVGPFKSNTPKVHNLKDLSCCPTELEIPNDLEELKKSKERMHKILEENQKEISKTWKIKKTRKKKTKPTS